MKYIVDFYKSLDTVNLIIFWVVIAVLLLLIIFSSILAHKNREDDEIIDEELDKDETAPEEDYDDKEIAREAGKISRKNKRIERYLEDDEYDDLAIKKDNIDTTNEETEDYVREEINNHIDDVIPEEPIYQAEPKKVERDIEEDPSFTSIDIPIIKEPEAIKENKFIVEEHVREYNNESFELPNLEKNNIKEETPIIKEEYKEPIIEKREEPVKEVIIPTGAYQRNVLREVYPSQTSPIGIVNKVDEKTEEIKKAEELNKLLTPEKPIVQSRTMINENNYRRQTIEDKPQTTSVPKRVENIPVTDYSSTVKKGNYLEELSKKMAQSAGEDINRTRYELEQEEAAIISYNELMQKKDSIKTIDEEDAIISIDELTRRKKEQERVYNITGKENDDEFINALKNFRSDL